MAGNGVYWDQFTNGGNAVAGDQFVGLRTVSGQLTNYRFNFNASIEHILQREVTQTAHGFVVDNVLTLSGSTYILAKADAASTSDVIGTVIGVTDADNFILWFGGWANTLTGLSAGTTYFLSAATAGAFTSTAPSTPGQVRVPLFKADSSTSAYWIYGGGVQQL